MRREVTLHGKGRGVPCERRDMRFTAFMKREDLRIRTIGARVLGEKAAPVLNIDEELGQLAARMVKAMQKADGVGLAAPQIGVALRLVVLGLPSGMDGSQGLLSPGEVLMLPRMPLCLVNPEISPLGTGTVCAEEGCLSVPGVYANVARPERIMVTAGLLNGESLTLECGGFLARVIQHEVDHLEGILFVERLDDAERERVKTELEISRKACNPKDE